MKKWYVALRERYEQDRITLLDYREIDIEFRLWFIDVMKDVNEIERSESSSIDDSLCNDRICDREHIWTEQDKSVDTGFDNEDAQRTERYSEQESESAEIVEYEDTFDDFYEEVTKSKMEKKSKPKKKKHKKK